MLPVLRLSSFPQPHRAPSQRRRCVFLAVVVVQVLSLTMVTACCRGVAFGALRQRPYTVGGRGSAWSYQRKTGPSRARPQNPAGGRSRTALSALPDLNLAAWFAAQLSDMPARVAEYGPLGPAYFIAVAAIAEVLTFPTTPVMLSSGYIFGMLGVGVMLVSMSCAASMHFVLSRSLLRPMVEEFVAGNEKVQTINRAVEREGFTLMFLMRLEPMLPSSITNFAFGLTSTSYFEFLAATAFGYIPYTLVMVSSATVLKDVFTNEAEKPWFFYVVGGAFYVGLLWLITDVAGKAIKEATKEESSLHVTTEPPCRNVLGDERVSAPGPRVLIAEPGPPAKG